MCIFDLSGRVRIKININHPLPLIWDLENYEDVNVKKDIDYSINLVNKMIKVKEMETSIKKKIIKVYTAMNSFDSENHVIKNDQYVYLI
jgi:hypothetical protein